MLFFLLSYSYITLVTLILHSFNYFKNITLILFTLQCNDISCYLKHLLYRIFLQENYCKHYKTENHMQSQKFKCNLKSYKNSCGSQRP